jgi:cell division FtsZ-interacting protein ZapD
MGSPSYENIIEFLLQRAEAASTSSSRLLALILLHNLLDIVNGERKFELGSHLLHLLAKDTTGILDFNQRSLIDEVNLVFLCECEALTGYVTRLTHKKLTTPKWSQNLNIDRHFFGVLAQ